MNLKKAFDPLLEELLGIGTARRIHNRAMYDTPVVRGVVSDSPDRAHRWWWPDENRDKTTEFSGLEGATLLGQLDRRGFLVIDGQNNAWSDIPLKLVPENIRKRFVNQDPEYRVNTNLIGEYAKDLGYPGVHFKNIQDGGTIQDQYYVIDLKRRRGRFAKFEDIDSDDLMAGLPLALLGSGAAFGAMGQDNDEEI